MDDNKVYEPVEVQPVPFPQQDPITIGGSSGSSKSSDVHEQPSTTPQIFPIRHVAHDLLSDVLNTRSKKVRGQFDLVDSGGFRIGTYAPGVSGEMVLTPAGQSAKNKAGQITFAIDAETGDVIFLGEIRGGTIDIGNNFTVDADGNVIASAIQLASSIAINSSNGINQIIGNSETDITGSSISFTLQNPSLVSFILTGHAKVEQGGAGDFYGNGLYRLYVNSSDVKRGIVTGGIVGTDRRGAVDLTSFATSHIATLPKGLNTVKVTGTCDQVTNTSQTVLYNYVLTIFTQGAVFS